MLWDAPFESDPGYEPTRSARSNYLDYLMSEPVMDQALEAVAALEEDQRRVLVEFLRQITPGDHLKMESAALLRAGATAG